MEAYPEMKRLNLLGAYLKNIFRKKNILILGYGEIGKALENIYGHKYNILKIEEGKILPPLKNIEILDVCIPYSDEFIDIIKDYIRLYKPKLTIIHSTVYPGTTKKISKSNIVYSPVIGIHPYLEKSIKTFKKFIGSNDRGGLKKVKRHFKRNKIKFKVLQNSKTVETAKLLSTLYYGMCISFHDDVNNLCKKEKLNFDQVMTEWNKEYNLGYKKMDIDNVIRPILEPANGKIGGHCIIPNAEIIKNYFNSEIVDYVLKLK
jgi:hypothetical protein